MGSEVGVLELYTPDENVKVVADVVFVHGLFGHHVRTWSKKKSGKKRSLEKSEVTSSKRSPWSFFPLNVASGSNHNDYLDEVEEQSSPENSVFWPKDLLPKRIPDIRVLTWGYDVGVSREASTASIYQHATQLLFDLVNVRRGKATEERPIIFVAHSLGGIVVKEALEQSEKYSKDYMQTILPATRGICFLGTPHRGSSNAYLAEIGAQLTKALGMNPNLQVITALKTDSETLLRTQRNFTQLLHRHKIEIKSFHESADTNRLRIVGRFSSALDDTSDVPTDIPGNHMDIAKFEDENAKGFKDICHTLTRWREDIQTGDESIEQAPDEQPQSHTTAFQQDKERDLRVYQRLEEDVYKSLKSPNRNRKYRTTADSHPGTCSWLFDSSSGFSDWLSDAQTSTPIFWISGYPGSGKSTLMKYAMNSDKTMKLLEQAEPSQWGIISFFYDYDGDQIQKTVEGLAEEFLCSLLELNEKFLPYVRSIRALNLLGDDSKIFRLKNDILCSKTVAVPELNRIELRRLNELLSSQRDDYRSGSSPVWSPEALEAASLLLAAQKDVLSNVCFLVDGLDEQEDNQQWLIEWVKNLVTASNLGSLRLKFCLASRPETIFTNSLKMYPRITVQDHTLKDIRSYVSGCLKQSASYLSNRNDVRELEYLINEITTRARGVFIWVKLVVRDFCECIEDGGLHGLREKLEYIPFELEKLYGRILETRKLDYGIEKTLMLKVCLSEALKPETFFAVIDHHLHSEVVHPMSNELMESRLWSRCGGLLQLPSDPSTDTGPVNFCHRTARAFAGNYLANTSLAQVNGAASEPHAGSVFTLQFVVFALVHMDLKSLGVHSKCLSRLFEIYNDAEKDIGADADAILDELLEPAFASTKIENLIQQSPQYIDGSTAIEIRPHGGMRDITPEQYIRMGLFKSAYTRISEPTKPGPLDALHCFELYAATEGYGFKGYETLYSDIFEEQSLHRVDRPIALVIWASLTISSINFIQRRLHFLPQFDKSLLLLALNSIMRSAFIKDPYDSDLDDSDYQHSLRTILEAFANRLVAIGKLSAETVRPFIRYINSRGREMAYELLKTTLESGVDFDFALHWILFYYADAVNDSCAATCMRYADALRLFIANGGDCNKCPGDCYFCRRFRLYESGIGFCARRREHKPCNAACDDCVRNFHTPLFFAILYDCRDGVEILLQNGADPFDLGNCVDVFRPGTWPRELDEDSSMSGESNDYDDYDNFDRFALHATDMQDLFERYKDLSWKQHLLREADKVKETQEVE